MISRLLVASAPVAVASCGGNILTADPVELLAGETYTGDVLTTKRPVQTLAPPTEAEMAMTAEELAAAAEAGAPVPPPPVESIRPLTGRGDYPSLGSVPERPRDVPTAAERAAAFAELQADRAAAEALRAGDSSRGSGQSERESAPPGVSALLTVVPFAAGSSEMDATARDGMLRQVAAVGPTARLRLVGLTGGDLSLALARANAVATFLVSSGVDTSRLVLETAAPAAGTSIDAVEIHTDY